MQDRLLASGIFVVGSSAEEYASLLAEDIARYTEIIRVAGIRLE
jgi:hypothetical protein